MLISDRRTVIVCELDGWLLDLAAIRKALHAVTAALDQSPARAVVFDLRDVRVADLALRWMVAHTDRRMRTRHGQVVVANAGPSIARLLRTGGLDETVLIFELPAAPAERAAQTTRATVRRRAARAHRSQRDCG